MLRVLCNACKREMPRDQVASSVIVAREWGARHPELVAVLKTDWADDVFCPEHLPYASDYWTDKVLVFEKQAAVVAATLSNHCKEFFKKAVNESQAIPREPEQIFERSKNEAAAG